MALSFEKLIADVQGFNDSTEIPVTIGNGDSATTERLRLGDIRGQLSNTLARYEAALQQEREQRGTLEQTLRALRDAPANAVAAPSPAPTASPGEPSDDDLNTDPWTRRLSRKLEDNFNQRLEEATKKIREEHTGFADLSRKGVGALTSLLLKLQAQQEFNSLKGWPEGYDAERAFREASDPRHVKNGLPSLASLHHDITEEQRIQEMATARAEKMYEDRIKAETKNNQSKFDRLGVPGGVRAKAPKKSNEYRTLQEYMMSDDAMPTSEEIQSMTGMLGMIR